ncbi:MAG: undecaprenyldiphospho-muramoylpentapeptide beta-N-acetylglucosaminyltransferase [Oscillospiraceae bacterium]|nr:undecaprenyldiphospho-muramoylpentapeptide beta-N-acetylglucosaminyltransferase [Oscillospiraceae bacterium]
MKRIVLTGGGSAGHVTPNLALIPHLLRAGWDVHYIGTAAGLERDLAGALPGVTYHAIHSGKLRRYFDLRNLADPFRVLWGAMEAQALLGRLRPRLVFAKGGFVSVPVVYGAWLHRVPVILHESDLTPGLANRLCAPLAKVICTTFPEAARSVGRKGVCTGTPLRAEILEGSRGEGLRLCGFSPDKPVLMMVGGSQGAVSVNRVLRQALPQLLADFQVLHLCGKGNLDAALAATPGYRQFEYMQGELRHAYAAADIVLSRAGSNVLSELLALRKPALLVPYPATASRGDQIDNAHSMARRNLAAVLMQEVLTVDTLLAAVRDLYARRGAYVAAMETIQNGDGTQEVLTQINRVGDSWGRGE